MIKKPVIMYEVPSLLEFRRIGDRVKSPKLCSTSEYVAVNWGLLVCWEI